MVHETDPAADAAPSLRSRAALAAAWLALQLMRLIFLPFLLVSACLDRPRRDAPVTAENPQPKRPR